MDSYRDTQSDRGLPGRPSAGHGSADETAERRLEHVRRGAPSRSDVAVTQVCLSRENVVLVARLSASTRLSSHPYVPRVVILRLLLQEALVAAVVPATVTTHGALRAGLRAHFERLRDMPGHRLTELAGNLTRWRQSAPGVRTPGNHRASSREGRGSVVAREPTTLRLPNVEIVALDSYRNDIRQASGLCVSRSAVLRATIESFARAFQV